CGPEGQSTDVQPGHDPLDLVAGNRASAVDAAKIETARRTLEVDIEGVGSSAPAGDGDRPRHGIREEPGIAQERSNPEVHDVAGNVEANGTVAEVRGSGEGEASFGLREIDVEAEPPARSAHREGSGEGPLDGDLGAKDHAGREGPQVPLQVYGDHLAQLDRAGELNSPRGPTEIGLHRESCSVAGDQDLPRKRPRAEGERGE